MSSSNYQSPDMTRKFSFDSDFDEDTGHMPVLGDPGRLERQRIKRAELVRVHDHSQDYGNHLSLLVQGDAKRIQQQSEASKLPKKKEIINLKLDRAREIIEDKERELRSMRARK